MTDAIQYTDQLKTQGSINIAPEVIETIAGHLVHLAQGVQLAPSKANFQGLFFRENAVTLYQDEEGATILQVAVALAYGEDVQSVSLTLQRQIMEQVYFMTDIQLDKVNIRVENLLIPEEQAS